MKSGPDACEYIPLVGGGLRFWPDFLPSGEADSLLDCLLQQPPWQHSAIRIAGRNIQVPRLNVMYGDEGTNYSYSGTHLPVHPWLEELEQLKNCVSRSTDCPFNFALLNLYRNGQDSVDWHSDDEKELGPQPVVATISLGAMRRFDLRPRNRGASKAASGKRISRHLELPHGSLLVMEGGTQSHWHHRVPKIKFAVGQRISVTFRQVYGEYAAGVTG
jgi:alkylated DNA repair dioxygenase AlkB